MTGVGLATHGHGVKRTDSRAARSLPGDTPARSTWKPSDIRRSRFTCTAITVLQGARTRHAGGGVGVVICNAVLASNGWCIGALRYRELKGKRPGGTGARNHKTWLRKRRSPSPTHAMAGQRL
jgi:hypothetical protein